ncbi:hypothetical protein MNBD_GAMMA10-2711 [hydrothermal vent metagenome]|uniref:Uncharacterized protein n=1 Tax=hydrothermal vent metagenome TaxID=652676 RepID=A0A3B0YPF9_9ZZZZ
MNTKVFFEWIGAIAGVTGIIAGAYSAFIYFNKEKLLDESFFLGKYEGSAEGYEFTMGIESVGAGQLIGEVNFGEWDYVEVQLTGEYDKENNLVLLSYRRNENHPSGKDNGIAKITYKKSDNSYYGFWSSLVIAGNKQKWKLKKIDNSYTVESWGE